MMLIQETTWVWISGDGPWKEFSKCNMHPQEGYGKVVPVTVREKNDFSGSPNLMKTSTLSSVTTMSEYSAPISVYRRKKRSKNQGNPLAVFPTIGSTSKRPSEKSAPISVYKRRKIQRNPLSVFPTSTSTSTRPSDNCLSANSSDTMSVTAEKLTVSSVCENIRVPTNSNVNLTKCDKVNYAIELGSGDENLHKDFVLCGVNDSFSSSKSKIDLGSASLEPEFDDTGECSSSGTLVKQALQEDISERDLCIALLRSHGMFGGFKPLSTCTSAEPMDIQNDKSCLLSCKICLQSEISLKMLICDHCEEAFHVSCCNPSTKKIPVSEWLCHYCFRNKLKKLERIRSKSLNVVSDKRNWKTVTSKDESGPIAYMLSDTHPYTSKVCVGKEFQAEVPDWSGPKVNEDDYFGEAVESDPLEYGSSQGWDSNKPSRVISIGNWLQCQDVMYGVGEGVDGTICGKWRRAPLFEVQTNKWDCFSSVHWDPTHSDCAVPQELDTDQVLKQLKYIDMLRPRLTATRSKSSVKKGSDSQ